jgi:hypothetical protein
VNIKIKEVQVHVVDGEEGSWVTTPIDQTYDLKELVNGVLAQLATVQLASGKYTQMRLIIADEPGANTLVVCSDCEAQTDCEEKELKIPSGFQTGVKLVHPFTIVEGLTVELILDFDVDKSIVKAGSSGQYLLKPTIKVIGTIDNAIVSGRVTDSATGEGLPDAVVTAQKQSAAVDEKEIVLASTTTDADGYYTMYLEPGSYNIVAYKDGYNPECAVLADLQFNTSYTQDFALTEAVLVGTITGTVATSADTVTLSFRALGACGGGEEIEVTYDSVINGDTYSVDLPVGAYSIVALTDTETVVIRPVDVTDGGVETKDLTISQLETGGAATAEWAIAPDPVYTGDKSAHLQTTGTVGVGDEGRIVTKLPEGTTLGDIQSISWWEYLVAGYPPHVDVSLDADCDGVEDDKLVFEYAYNGMYHYDNEGPMPYGALTGAWYKTFSDDGNGPDAIDNNAGAWLNSGAPGAPGDAGFIFYTLGDWKTGIDLDNGTYAYDIDENTCVLGLEIEVDNWVVQSEAYVDDIVVILGP